ncbi:MAG: rRNA maturation RNase YbeY [Actinobacteria bacterium]|nr:rRNA maturation RNase YbeY [Actinomycetota bacterium]
MEIQINNCIEHFKLSKRLVTSTVSLLKKVAGLRSLGLLEIIFVDPVEMRSVNKRYFEKKEPTDVISLEYGKDEKHADSITGEVFICPHVALKNAREAGCPFKEELVRLVVHGCLHSLGMEHGTYNDDNPMYQLQEQIVKRVRGLPAFDSFVAELNGIG